MKGWSTENKYTLIKWWQGSRLTIPISIIFYFRREAVTSRTKMGILSCRPGTGNNKARKKLDGRGSNCRQTRCLLAFTRL